MSTLRALWLGVALLLSATAASSAVAAESSATAKGSVFCTPGTISTVSKPCTATPRCKAGQTSTKATPCNDAVHASMVDITTKAFADKEVVPIAIGTAAIDERKGNGDAVAVISFLDSDKGFYRLAVISTSGLGYINTFTWHSPVGMVLTSIASSRGGVCTLLNQAIKCRAGKKGIEPPKCTCLGGGSLTVDFYADGLIPRPSGNDVRYGKGLGRLQILTLTPVPYHLPMGPSVQVDFPICKQGQTSTKTFPCSTT